MTIHIPQKSDFWKKLGGLVFLAATVGQASDTKEPLLKSFEYEGMKFAEKKIDDALK